ncbi:MAG: hypothetical protein U0414_11240 [Polyangiaceae bacterium]
MNRTFSGALVAVALLTGSVVAAPARADQAADDAAVLMKDAAAAYEKGDFQTCRTKATEAWGKFQHAQIAGLLGTCEVKLEMYVEGATHLDFYVKHSSGAVNPESQEMLAKAKERVSEVTLSCTPGEVNWKIDGKPVESSTTTVFLEPGAHTIEAAKEGYKPKQEPQKIAAGTKMTVTISLEPEPKGAGGGGAGGAAPDTGGSKLPIWPGAVLLGAGAVGLGVGIGLVVAAAGNDSDAVAAGKGLTCNPNNLSAACQGVADSLSAKDGLNTGGAVALTLGGAMAVTGAILLPLAIAGRGSPKKDDEKPATAWTVVPVVSSTYGGLTWLGAF